MGWLYVVSTERLLCFGNELKEHKYSLSRFSLFLEGIAGLAVTYGLNINMAQAWMIWNLCSMENKIISVERILQYTCIPSEAPLVIAENRPGFSWPSRGQVDLHDLQVALIIIFCDSNQNSELTLGFCFLLFSWYLFLLNLS